MLTSVLTLCQFNRTCQFETERGLVWCLCGSGWWWWWWWRRRRRIVICSSPAVQRSSPDCCLCRWTWTRRRLRRTRTSRARGSHCSLLHLCYEKQMPCLSDRCCGNWDFHTSKCKPRLVFNPSRYLYSIGLLQTIG